MRRVPEPTSADVLLERARALGGRNLGSIAADLGVEPPTNLRRAKGWIGELIEAALGAPGGSSPEPDFPHLGVELKTLPLNRQWRPRESTWVCRAPMDSSLDSHWESSHVRRKLACVLWVPVVGDAADPPASRTVAAPFLWIPTEADESALAADWRELCEGIAGGEWWRLRGHVGGVLQLRPKAATGRDLVWALDEEANWVKTMPLGFYLRASFTRALVERLSGTM